MGAPALLLCTSPRFLLSALRYPHPRLICIQCTDGRGRGLVASRTVQPGELLLAVRPLALAWDDGLAALGSSLAQDPVGSEPTPGTPIDEDLDPDLGLEDAKFLGLQRQLLSRRWARWRAEGWRELASYAPYGSNGQFQHGCSWLTSLGRCCGGTT